MILEGPEALCHNSSTDLDFMEAPRSEDRINPYIAPIERVGPTEIKIAWTTRPWELGDDVLVLPANEKGGLGGSLARAFLKEAASAGELFRGEVNQLLGSFSFGPDKPLPVMFLDSRFPRIIVATTFGPSGAQPETATAAIIRLAQETQVRNLSLPILGAGRGGEDPIKTAAVMLATLRAVLPGSSLETVTFVTDSSGVFENLGKIPRFETAGERDDGLRPAEEIVSRFISGKGFKLDPDAREMMVLAGNLGPQRKPDDQNISTSLVFFALLHTSWSNVPESVYEAAATTLVRMLDGSGYERVEQAYFGGSTPQLNRDPGKRSIRFLTDNCQDLLDSACQLAVTEASRSLRVQHIAASFGLLRNGRILERLGPLGIDLPRLRELVNRAREQLGPKPRPTETDSAPQTIDSFISHVRTDDPRASSEDLLNVKEEVAAFAELIASRKTTPPLAIGIFGEWGSGKTFFMERLGESIDRIGRSGNEAFHDQIVQIRFNAWHYIETNLWASLVEFIFRELDSWLRLKEKPEDIEALFEQLATSRQLRLEAVRTLIERRAAMSQARTSLENAQRLHENAVANHSKQPVNDIWTAAVSLFWEKLEPGDKEKLNQAATQLGLAKLRDSEHALSGLVKDSRNQLERSRLVTGSLVRLLGSNALWVVGLSIAIPFVMVALRLALGSQGWIGELSPGFIGIASSLSTCTVFGGLFLKQATSAVDFLEQFEDKLQEQIAKATKTQRDAVSQADAELARACQAVSEAEKKLADATALAKEAEQDYRNDTARGRLNRFIRARVSDGEYAKHLSLIATIHRDFAQLAQIMQAGDTDEQANKEVDESRELYRKKLEELIDGNKDGLPEEVAADLRKEPPANLRFFSRIVLYIDDLDRCPPEKVADVLQAIHMFLFFRLFVVVVAVDARWVTRSLEKEFPHLIAPEGDTGGKIGVRMKGPRPATALDYLEKIFHIPFWVRSMSQEASALFVGGLTAPYAEPRTVAEQSAIDARPAPDRPAAPLAAPPVSAAVRATVPVSTMPYKTTVLSDGEIAMLNRFAPFSADSPRRAKRFVNLYNLLRTSLVRAGTIKGADDQANYTAVIALLAAFSSHPTKAERFLRDAANLSVSSPNPIVRTLAVVCDEIRTDPRKMEAGLVRLRSTIARYSFSGDLPAIDELVANEG